MTSSGDCLGGPEKVPPLPSPYPPIWTQTIPGRNGARGNGTVRTVTAGTVALFPFVFRAPPVPYCTEEGEESITLLPLQSLPVHRIIRTKLGARWGGNPLKQVEPSFKPPVTRIRVLRQAAELGVFPNPPVPPPGPVVTTHVVPLGGESYSQMLLARGNIEFAKLPPKKVITSASPTSISASISPIPL